MKVYLGDNEWVEILTTVKGRNMETIAIIEEIMEQETKRVSNREQEIVNELRYISKQIEAAIPLLNSGESVATLPQQLMQCASVVLKLQAEIEARVDISTRVSSILSPRN